MASESNIEWTHATFNPWRGCTKVAPECANCYAEQLGKRNPVVLGIWGKGGTRPVASESYWKEPFKWNEHARKLGERRRVFCGSLMDWAEAEDTMPSSQWPDVVKARGRLFDIIEKTPNLDWLMLTKRPENALNVVPKHWAKQFPDNVWCGTSAGSQTTAEKAIPELLQIPAGVRFISAEPLLTDVTFYEWFPLGTAPKSAKAEALEYVGRPMTVNSEYENGIHWVIVGCESRGKQAGRFANEYPEAARSIIRQCFKANVPVFHKQMPINGKVSHDMNEWTRDLRIRQFPKASHP